MVRDSGASWHETSRIYAYILADVTVLERVCQALGDAGVRYAVVGGYAVALYGAVRGTLDVDVALRWSREDLRAAVATLESIGLESRLPVTADEVYDFRDEYIANRGMVAWNFHNPGDPLEQVDIVIAYDLTGKGVRRLDLPNGPVRVLAIDDLIEMKRTSGRPQDLEDAAALERLR